MMEDMEAWEARISEAVSQVLSKAEQSYMKKSRFYSINFLEQFGGAFQEFVIFLDYFIKPAGEQ